MTFEEQFPSLKNKVEDGRLIRPDGSEGIADWVWLPMVERHCLDKQRVREAWNKAKAEWKKELEDECGAPQHDDAWDEFEEELGL